jgi:alpha-L-fucosidase
MYALVPFKEDESIPVYVEWKDNLPAKGTVMKLLQNGEKVKWELRDNSVRVFLPSGIRKNHVPALAFSFVPASK